MRSLETETNAPVEGDPSPWEARAFGVPFRGENRLIGLVPVDDAGPGARTTIESSTPATLEQLWAGRGELVREASRSDGMVLLRILQDDELGFHFESTFFGEFAISRDGLVVHCAPRVPAGRLPWEWQRVLVSSVLPSVAAIRGFGIFHASAVTLGDRAIAFLVHSGGGKSSVALNLVLRGAGFLADDVVAASLDEQVTAHPGATMAKLAPSEMATMSEEERERLGQLIGIPEREKAVIEVTSAARPAPLAAMYFLERGTTTSGAQIAPITADPVLLLGSAHAFGVTTPARLKTQLDVCARIAAEVPTFRISVPSTSAAREVAGVVEAHARSSMPERAS